MSQHKAAMERIHRGRKVGDAADVTYDDLVSPTHADSSGCGVEQCVERCPHGVVSTDLSAPHTMVRDRLRYVEDVNKHPLLVFLERHASVLLMPVLPLLWVVLFVMTMDRPSLLDTGAWATPLLTVLSATLANAAPVGGGVVFVPILSLFGVQIHLGGAAFAVSTMTFGNGVFGFLNWLRKDPSRISWGIVPYAVFPAWAGASVGTLRPFLTPDQASRCFGGFALVAAAVVGKTIVRGSGDIAKAFGGEDDDSAGCSNVTADAEEQEDLVGEANPKRVAQTVQPSVSLVLVQRKKLVASLSSLFSGLVLVSHIGVGNALTTFLVAIYIWRLPAKSAVVTAILCGGWTSICPFLLHLLLLRDVPIPLWVMGLPGVYAGARIAPAAHEVIGLESVLGAFVAFLIIAGAVMIFTG